MTRTASPVPHETGDMVPYRVRFRFNPSESWHEWVRFADNIEQAVDSASAALTAEYPGTFPSLCVERYYLSDL